MIDLVSVGIGIATDVLITDNLLKTLSDFANKIEAKKFVEDLKQWQIEFEQLNDGTIVTDSAFYETIKNHTIVENILRYVLVPSFDGTSEEAFIDNSLSIIITEIEYKKGHPITSDEKLLIQTYLKTVLSKCRMFVFEKISPDSRGTLYVLLQISAKVDEILRHLPTQLKGEDLASYILNSPQMQENNAFLLARLDVTQQKITELTNVVLAEKESALNVALVSNHLEQWNKMQIRNLGNRYIPELNIPLDLGRVLDGLCLNKDFSTSFFQKFDEFIIKIKRAHYKDLAPFIEELSKCVQNISFSDFSSDTLAHINSIVSDIQSTLEKRRNEEMTEDGRYKLYSTTNLTYTLQQYLASSEVLAAFSSNVLLVGDGGTGKSHLIGDFVQQQNQNQKGAILLLGQLFDGIDPLSVLPDWLGLPITYVQLFDAFETIACTQGSRFIFCIDALNEGPGIYYWQERLPGIVEFLNQYPHIRLLISVRTQYELDLFDEQNELRKQFVRVLHSGFSQVMPVAIHKYFTFFNITTNEFTCLNSEFSNPLFLRLFCIANENSTVTISDLTLPNTYEKYIQHIEKCVAKRCDYNPIHKHVRKIIDCLVCERMSQSKPSVRLPLETVLITIAEYSQKWHIQKDIYSALINEGVLTQSKNYNGEEYVYITYERLEDYFIARKIVGEYSSCSQKEFVETYNWVLSHPDLLQYISIILPEQKSVELASLFEISEPHLRDNLRKAFVYSLVWRKNDSITEESMEYIDNEVLNHPTSFCAFIDVLFSLSTRPNSNFNSDKSYNFFANLAMPDRDATFIPVFDKLYNDKNSALRRLLDLTTFAPDLDPIKCETSESLSTILSWLLISPNNKMRDQATRGLITILHTNMRALTLLMKRFEAINDPYIIERIYAVAFGCVVNTADTAHIKDLAIYIYNQIFDKQYVYPNILLRTYAKNIIDYSLYIGCLTAEDISIERINPPYHSLFPDIPTDEEIQKFNVNVFDKTIDPCYYAQNRILRSMEVEYGRNGRFSTYGDFGRYIFQSYFSDWPDLHPIDLKNIAIKRIFELGYDAEKHGRYDKQVMSHSDYHRSERIGKKYQWISLFELAAQVSDNKKLVIHDNHNNPILRYVEGSYYPSIRNIDPTIILYRKKETSSGYHSQYHIPDISYGQWINDFSDALPNDQLIRIKYNGESFVLLEGQYTWLEDKKLGFDDYELPRKKMWNQILGFIVNKSKTDELINDLSDKDFMGDWLPRARGDSEIFNREFYWSDAYHFFTDPSFGSPEWDSISCAWNKISFKEKVLIPVRQYYSERKGDPSCDEDEFYVTWYKVCGDIFNELNLTYGNNTNSCLYDEDGNIICFDSKELIGEDIGYFIKEASLQKYLEMRNLCLIWTSLCEKTIIGERLTDSNIPKKNIHCCALYKYNGNEILEKSKNIFNESMY